MSFFIKGSKNKGKKRRLPSKPQLSNGKVSDEIYSEEDEEYTNHISDKSDSEDADETAQEKKIRLAKFYLKEIAKEENLRIVSQENVNGTTNGDLVSKRLKEDYLKKTGKLRLCVAENYERISIEKITSLKCKEHNQSITCLCLSEDNHVYSGSKDGSIVKWSLDEKRRVGRIPFVSNRDSCVDEFKGHSKAILSIAVSSDNKFIAIADETNDIQVWHPKDFKHLGTLKGHRNSVTGLVLRKNTNMLYSCSKDRCIKVWLLDEMSYVETLYGHQDAITSIDALSREQAITSGGRDVSIRLWKIPEESQLIYNGHSGSIDVVRLINEEHFISGGDDGSLCVWSTLRKRPSCFVKEAHGRDSVTAEPNWICAIEPFLNSDLVATGSCDGFVKLWKIGDNFRTINLLASIPIPGFVNSLRFTSTGSHLLAGTGREHKDGRWTVIKSAKNVIFVIPLLRDD